jgi:hypothetical protein
MSPENLSRRAIMASAAVLPAVPALPVASAIACVADPDAELLQLGAEFEPIIHEWAAQRAIDLRRHEAWEAACIRAGLPRIEFGSIPDDEYRSYQDKRRNVRTEYSEEEDAELDEEHEGVLTVWDEIHDRLNPRAQDIISRKAQTVAGLAVQTRAMTVYYAELWHRHRCSPQHGVRERRCSHDRHHLTPRAQIICRTAQRDRPQSRRGAMAAPVASKDPLPNRAPDRRSGQAEGHADGALRHPQHRRRLAAHPHDRVAVVS